MRGVLDYEVTLDCMMCRCTYEGCIELYDIYM